MHSLEIKLKAFKIEDANLTFNWLQNRELREDFLMGEISDIETHIAYFEKKLEKKDELVYKIVVNDSHVGNCGYKNIQNNCAELWIYIGDRSFSGKGLGELATRELIKLGFDLFGFSKIYLHVAKKNIKAYRMYTKIGFYEAQAVENQSGIFREEVVYMELKKQNILKECSDGV